MALGWSAAALNTAIDAHIAAYPWIQLHTADPGSAGTTAVAGNATRKDVTNAFAPASGGSATSDVDVDWTDNEVDTTEDYTHFTLWTASSNGSFGSSGTVTANSVNASGDAFSILSGGIVLSGTVAS